ncbi:MAG TPA: hypothetical protein PLD51_05620 [Pontiellaceae bacterium]|nr:hypothetical protein [Pontiellaceae bacterium]HPR83320.1 hypothetical protein [Pontiellaceae bacterium]
MTYKLVEDERVNITFHYKDGTSVHYQKIYFFNMPYFPLLIFNGLNSAIVIDKERIESVSVKDKEYSIDRLDIEKGTENQLLHLKEH